MFALSIISVVLAIASTATSMYSSYEQTEAQEDQMEYEATRAKNAGIAKQRAMASEADRRADLDRKKLGKSINVLSQRGLDITTGSPLMALAEQHADASADQNEMKRQGSIAYLTGLNQSEMYKTKAQSLDHAQGFNVGAEGLYGASQIAGASRGLYGNSGGGGGGGGNTSSYTQSSNVDNIKAPQMTPASQGVSFLTPVR